MESIKRQKISPESTRQTRMSSQDEPAVDAASVAETQLKGAPKAFGPLGIRGFSHISINVNNMEDALEFYNRVLGFEKMQGGKEWDEFDFRGLDSEPFAKNAGFMDGKVKCDCVWLWHPHLHMNLELFCYYEPKGKNRLDDIPKTQDVGGIKHASFEVEDIEAAFNFLKNQKGVTMVSQDAEYKPNQMKPFPFKFFFWIDPFGVQWEMEEYGENVVTNLVPSVTRNMDAFVSLEEATL